MDVKTKPKFERGYYFVSRFCCTSGNCVLCHAGGRMENRKHVIHTDNVSKEWAEFVASNWSRYGAKARPRP